MSSSRQGWSRVVFGGLSLLVLLVVFQGPAIYGDLLWFDAVGYASVFLTVLGYRVALFTVTFLPSVAVLYASYRVARRRLEGIVEPGPQWPYLLAIVGVSFLIGLQYASAWDVVLRYLNATPFGVTDPVYGLDVAFYVYGLPFYNLVLGYVLLLAVTGLLLSLAMYARPFAFVERETVTGAQAVEFDAFAFLTEVRRHAFGHLVVYLGVGVIVMGVGFYLDRYELLYSTRGAVFGMGATDQAVYQPVLALEALTAVVGGLVILAGARLGDARAVTIPIAILVGFLVFGSIAGAGYQGIVVSPDEFNKERPFLENEIEFTNRAYALDRVDEREFPVSESLTPAQIDANPGTIDNVRLWDPRPLLTTYNELQIFRTYYTFTDVDVDRYMIDGQETQVMISAREVDTRALPETSQTWVNRHLVYTHGFGVVMSPVSKITGQGLPQLYIRDIPPNSTVGIDVTQPRIYYGETTTDYAIVNTGTRELDYPSGNQNVYATYEGPGGVLLDSRMDRLVYSIKFGAPQIILSDSVRDGSRLQFNRDIQTRAPRIAPFLEYDRDPYIVVSNGKLYWIYDAYTTTDQYPYSDRSRFKGAPTNYVRNSVKVVIDAYTGETTYYVVEPDDPLINTYRKAFPGLFEDIDRMPSDLRQHIRYPEDAFRVQAMQYLDYHMTDPQVFYNKEDAWRIPDEVARGEQIPMDPYYIIMTLPGEENPEFVMIQPYIPTGRENMIGWLGARSDPPNYGTLRSFLFSKQQLVFGPMQIESRIDQDAEISQQITLWSQSGSSVLRGNLLAIPIDDTIIYVEPLFLESQEQGSLPELKRVIVAQGDQVVMEPTLERALAVRFGAAPPSAPGPGDGTLSDAQLERARTLYAEAQAALREGDFETYAQRITELGDLLDEAAGDQPVNETAG